MRVNLYSRCAPRPRRPQPEALVVVAFEVAADESGRLERGAGHRAARAPAGQLVALCPREPHR